MPASPPSLKRHESWIRHDSWSHVRALALDLDGTLLTSSGGVSDATVDALSGFVHTGGRVVIATGRGRQFAEGLATMLRDRGLYVYAIVCCDGGLVVHDVDGADAACYKVVWSNQPKGTDVPLREILAELPGAGVAAELDGAGVVIGSQHYIDAIWQRRCGVLPVHSTHVAVGSAGFPICSHTNPSTVPDSPPSLSAAKRPTPASSERSSRPNVSAGYASCHHLIDCQRKWTRSAAKWPPC